MRKPFHVIVAFSVCLAVVMAAVAWVSHMVLDLERAEKEARRQAVTEENVRLALWRMDSMVAPVIALETSRAVEWYDVPERTGKAAVQQMRVPENKSAGHVAASVFDVPHVLLHFEVGRKGGYSFPSLAAMPEQQGALAVQFAGDNSPEMLLAAVPEAESEAPPDGPQVIAFAPGEKKVVSKQSGKQQVESQQARTAREFANRAQSFNELNLKAGQQQLVWAIRAGRRPQNGVMQAVWLKDRLLLLRRATRGGARTVQGCWLDWPEMKEWMLAEVGDLFVESDLVPVIEPSEEDGARMLATLPVRFAPGRLPDDYIEEGLSPVRVSLLMSAGAVLVAALAVGALLWGVVSLSERRAAFVSAVTHELRTPLTTFRMYTEMLSGDMVADAGRRKEYLATLESEADRLTHLVENVLMYSRLERNKAWGKPEALSLESLLSRMKRRLKGRARRDDMELVVDTCGAGDIPVLVDVSIVEQILVNLVDNACKYASSASDRRIHVSAVSVDGRTGISVRDHGPGVDDADLPRLFRPFSKSAKDAANSAPGIGLGLAISRRLARSMGGDLLLEGGADEGARFVLTLRKAPGRSP